MSSQVVVALVFHFVSASICPGILGQSRGETVVTSHKESTQIYSTIFRKYDPRVRPPRNHSEAVVVRVDVELKHIYSLKIEEEELSSLVAMSLRWTDRRLAWYPQNLQSVVVDKLKIWIPEISFINGISRPTELSKEKLQVTAKGDVTWYRELAITTLCKTDLANDTQDCQLILGSFIYTQQEQELKGGNFSLSPSFSSHRWKATAGENMTMELRNSKHKDIICNVYLSRKAGLDAVGKCSMTYSSMNSNSGPAGFASLTTAAILIFTRCFA